MVSYRDFATETVNDVLRVVSGARQTQAVLPYHNNRSQGRGFGSWAIFSQTRSQSPLASPPQGIMLPAFLPRHSVGDIPYQLTSAVLICRYQKKWEVWRTGSHVVLKVSPECLSLSIIWILLSDKWFTVRGSVCLSPINWQIEKSYPSMCLPGLCTTTHRTFSLLLIMHVLCCKLKHI